MHTEPPITRFQMVSLPRRPGDCYTFSLKVAMRVLTSLLMSLVFQVSMLASEPFTPKLDDEWVTVDGSSIKAKYKDWDLQLWSNKRNGNLLTIAKDPIARQLDSWGDLDRAMDFATSAYPEWISNRDFPTWKNANPDLDCRFIKLQQSKLTIKKSELAAVEFSMVNDQDDLPLMANGFVVNLSKSTYYVQLTSIRPISDMIPRDLVRQLHQHYVP